ncbi:MAG: hypothetical protein ACOCUU_02950 [Nanoarchaeota archaeon]
MIKVRTDPHDFGLIIPMKTGVVWEHQCDGICCNQIQQEGIFIPLKKRYFISETKDDYVFFSPGDNMPFDYEDITFKHINEKDIFRMIMQEAYEWIIFKGWKDKEDKYGRSLNKFIGKKMLLIYQNSD